MKIKKLMASPPVLTLPTSNGRYILYSDTSKTHAWKCPMANPEGKTQINRDMVAKACPRLVQTMESQN